MIKLKKLAFFVVAFFSLHEKTHAIEFYTHGTDGNAVILNGVPQPIAGTGARAFALALMQELLKDQPNTQIRTMPLTRALRMLQSDRPVIAGGVIQTEERLHHFQWIAPLYNDKYCFYESTRTEKQVKTMQEAARHSVCVVSDSAAASMVRDLGFHKIEKTNSYSTCLRMLVAGRVHYVPLLDGDFRAKLHAAELSEQDVKKSNLPSIPIESYLVASLAVPEQDIKQYRTALINLKTSKRYQELRTIYWPK